MEVDRKLGQKYNQHAETAYIIPKKNSHVHVVLTVKKIPCGTQLSMTAKIEPSKTVWASIGTLFKLDTDLDFEYNWIFETR